jgi:hypothetical protein
MQGTCPPAFAQEPKYNVMDMDFLASLKITVKKVNTAFDLVNKKIFVFQSNTEYRVSMEIMRLDAELYLGGIQLRFTVSDATTKLYTSGFTGDLACTGLTGSRAVALVETNFEACRKWFQSVDLATPELHRASHVFVNTVLAYRQESVFGK